MPRSQDIALVVPITWCSRKILLSGSFVCDRHFTERSKGSILVFNGEGVAVLNLITCLGESDIQRGNKIFSWRIHVVVWAESDSCFGLIIAGFDGGGSDRWPRLYLFSFSRLHIRALSQQQHQLLDFDQRRGLEAILKTHRLVSEQQLTWSHGSISIVCQYQSQWR